jgi:hypothetical protein
MTIRPGKARLRAIASVLIPIILLLACDAPTGLFAPQTAQSLYSVALSRGPTSAGGSEGEALEEGAVLAPGAVVSIKLSSQGQSSEASSISVSISRSGASLAEARYEKRSAQAVPRAAEPGLTEVAALSDVPLPVTLPPNLPEGYYELVVDVSGDQTVLFQKRLPIFVSTASIAIQSIQVSPATVAPGSMAAAQARIDASPGADPYLVWSYDGAVLKRGLLSSGADQTLWKAPGAEAVYTLSLSVYPFAPPDAVPYAFRAPVERTAKVTVKRPSPDPANPFEADPGFVSLFHFDGTIQDSADSAAARALTRRGEPEAVIYGPGFGLRFDEASSVTIDSLLIPEKDGRLEAFTLMARLSGAQDPAPRASASPIPSPSPSVQAPAFSADPALSPMPALSAVPSVAPPVPSQSPAPPRATPAAAAPRSSFGTAYVFRSESSLPGFALELAVGATGEYLLSVSSGAAKAVSPSGILPDGRIHDLAVSVVPEEKGLFVRWFWDNKSVRSELLSIDMQPVPESGRCFIGGPGSATTILDEFGVFSSSDKEPREPWTGAYETLMRKTLKGAFIFAEGFDGIRSPESVPVSGNAAEKRGALVLSSGASAALPLPKARLAALDLEIALRQNDNPQDKRDFAFIASADGQELLRIGQNGKISASGADRGRVSGFFDGQTAKLKVLRDSSGAFLMNGAQRIPIGAAGLDASKLGFSIVSLGQSLSIESILISVSEDAEALSRAAARRPGA